MQHSDKMQSCAKLMQQKLTYDVFPLPVGPMIAFNPLGSKPLYIPNINNQACHCKSFDSKLT